MKIAFIVLCHKNPKQINLLLQALLNCNCDIYVHLDLKNRKIISEIKQNEHIFILSEEKSYSIDWGGISMIQATLSLIKEVRASKQKYDYICLLSGQDFPLKSMRTFDSILDGSNYIEVLSREDESYNYYKKRCEVPYPSWINGKSILIKSIKRLYMLFTGGYSHTFPFFIRNKRFDFDFEFGSQWWCLTYDCVMWMLDYSDSHPDYLNYLKNTIVPDETFFQTLFMASPFKTFWKNNLTYINWNREINRRSPLVFTIDDIDRLKTISKDFYFARKFDISVDNKVIDLLHDWVK